MTPLTFFQFIAHLEQSGSLIPGAWSVKLTFLLIVVFYLQKMKTELKNLSQNSDNIALRKGTTFAKKAVFLQKSAGTRVSWY